MFGVIDVDLFFGNFVGYGFGVLYGFFINFDFFDVDSFFIDDWVFFMGYDVLGVFGKFGIVSGDFFVKGNVFDVDFFMFNWNFYGFSVVNDVFVDMYVFIFDLFFVYVEVFFVVDDWIIFGDWGFLISCGLSFGISGRFGVGNFLISNILVCVCIGGFWVWSESVGVVMVKFVSFVFREVIVGVNVWGIFYFVFGVGSVDLVVWGF